jgi:hypothetical protein
MVVEGGRAWRPDLMAWLTDDGRVLSSRAVHPEAPESVACEVFEAAMATPLPGAGPPCRPRVLVVSDEELREALVTRYGGAFEVSVGDVSGADQYLDVVFDEFGSSYDLDTQPMLAGGLVTPAMVRGYLDAMRELHQAVPWAVITEEHPLLRVRIAARGVDGCANLIADDTGQGLAFFRSVADYQSEREVLPRPERPAGTRNLVACFDAEEDVSDERFDELDLLGWDHATVPGWVPGLAAFDYRDHLRPLEPEDIDLAITCARALAALARAPEHLDDGTPYTLRVRSEGLSGAVDVELTMPHPDFESEVDAASGPASTDASRAEIAVMMADLMGLHDLRVDVNHPGRMDTRAPMQLRVASLPAVSAPPPVVPAKETPTGKVRWEPAPGDTLPAADAPCPCGSGRRYKKCCKRR